MPRPSRSRPPRGEPGPHGPFTGAHVKRMLELDGWTLDPGTPDDEDPEALPMYVREASPFPAYVDITWNGIHCSRRNAIFMVLARTRLSEVREPREDELQETCRLLRRAVHSGPLGSRDDA